MYQCSIHGWISMFESCPKCATPVVSVATTNTNYVVETPTPGKKLTPMAKAIENIKFLEERADHPFAKIAYGMAISVCELHLEAELEYASQQAPASTPPVSAEVCDCCGSTESHLQYVCHNCRNKWTQQAPPVSANDAALMDVDKLDGVYAVNLSWGINYHPTDLSKVMKAKDCLFIGTGKECADFIYKNKPAPVSANDMTADEFFNHPDGMFTLNFLTMQEQQTLYKAVDLYAAGKVRQALLAAAPVSAMEDGWVEIKEGCNMPSDNEDCLVWTELATKWQASIFNNKRFYRYSNAVESDRMALYYFPDVVKWHPLPPPPSK